MVIYDFAVVTKRITYCPSKLISILQNVLGCPVNRATEVGKYVYHVSSNNYTKI